MLRFILPLCLLSFSIFSYVAKAQDDQIEDENLSSHQPTTPLTETDIKNQKIGDKLNFIPNVVAVVDQEDINGNRIKSAVSHRLNELIKKGETIPPEKELRDLTLQATEQLIDQILLTRAARQADFKPELKMAEKQISKLEKQLGTERFKKALRTQHLTRESFLEQTANKIAINQWVEQEIFPINVEESEIKAYYKMNEEEIVKPEKTKVSHILIAFDKNSKNQKKAEKEALSKLKKAAEEIEGPESFAKAAKKYSDCPSSKNGGRLPPFSRGEMVPPFEKAAFAAEPGEISGPVKTEYGYHYILTHEHTEKEQLSYEHAKDKIERIIFNRKLNQAIEKVLEEQRSQAEIKILLDQ